MRLRLFGVVMVLVLAAVAAAAQAQEPVRGATYVPGEVLVVLKDSPAGGLHALSSDVAATARQEAVLLRLQTKYGVTGGQPGSGRIHVLKTDRSIPALCGELGGDPEVEYAQPNYIYRICREPNDPDFADQYAHQLIQMTKAWDISTGSRDIVIAVLGTGVDVNHPDLKDNIWVNKAEIAGNGIDDDKNGYLDDIHGWNFEEDNNTVTPGTSSSSNHETQVAGVIGAIGNNGQGVVGVNWQCSIMVLRVSLSFTSKEVAAALDYAAANGARVVNMSFGGPFGPEDDKIVKAAIDRAYSKGVLLVASAGNSDSSQPHYPAAYYNVMAVSSTNGEDTKTGHSTFGPWVDIAAPGTDIVTTDLGNKYIATAGTSFSSPYVAAVAALVLSYRPNLTSVQVRAVLENTTDPLYYGDLDPNLCYIGTGRVNAYQALLNADADYPLGEVAAPQPRQTYASDVNTIGLCVFVHGDSYRLDYGLFGQTDWTAIAQGPAPTDPNGLVHVPLANPGVGTYELRLSTSRGEYTHTERAVFSVDLAPEQAHWPKPERVDEATLEYFLGNPLCLDLNGDGRNEIVQASLDYSDYYNYSAGGTLNIWTQDGNSLPHWPVQFDTGWPTSVAVGDIDGDGDYEVIAACEYDGEVDVFHVENGQIVDGNWPVIVGDWGSYIAACPVLADLDGDGASEIIVALDAESAGSAGLYAIRGDGSFLWQRRYTSEGPISVADINQDGKPEIALSGYGPGLSSVYTFILDSQGQQIARWKGGSQKGTAVGDLNGDGKIEMVFCTDVDVEAVRADGTTVWKAKVPAPFDTKGGLCIGDIDGDGLSEVYVSSYVEANGFIYSMVYGFDAKGKPLTDAGFPKTIMGAATRCVPLVADIDGDGQKELVVGSAYEPLMAWEADGSVTPGFPMLNLNPDAEMTPTLADLDQNGHLELLLSADDYRFHVLDLPGGDPVAKIDWGMARHDPQNSGWTAAIPQLDVITAPAEIRSGQKLQVQLTATNPANLPLHWTVGNLPEGAYYDAQTHTLFWKPAADQTFRTYTFSFLVSDGIRQNRRSVSITVVPNAIYSASMDTDPNWTLDPGWAWGTPTGKGSWNGDPNVGHTGKNVLGYALDGDYADNLTQTRYATTPPINCRGYKNIRLSFWRWLGVEAPYDYACIQVSSDGVTWIDLWTTGVSHVSDGAWQLMEYAVPAGVAEGQATVYFRWGLGPTDDFVTCPGWNLDDVQVTGDQIAN
ncbi:MAG: S8 family serine peptidase [Phycisphaerae bacterium]|nr:S8 family serine peptidase [Phycisphaerae bacterium]